MHFQPDGKRVPLEVYQFLCSLSCSGSIIDGFLSQGLLANKQITCKLAVSDNQMVPFAAFGT